MKPYILKALKERKMAGKTIRLNWEEWKEYCLEHSINPYENCENSHDLGGGNSYEVVCVDEPIREEDT